MFAKRSGSPLCTIPRHEQEFVSVYFTDTGHVRALIFTVDSYLDVPNKVAHREGVPVMLKNAEN